MKTLPKIVFTDIDGVWTDGGMYYDQKDNEWKKFNTRDSAGVLFLRHLNIPLVVLTGEQTQIMSRRAEKLKIEHCVQGVKNKVEEAQKWLERRNLNWDEAAYIGDDLIDARLLDKVGFSACPADAVEYIKERVDVVLKHKGGEGAFREFVEVILSQSGKLNQVLDELLNE
jgi:3-deoxy-D-manno-octulosonate 8-phosphate phosphatase (KDO 8-P phosphatase)